jgi:hypothetical protein
MLGYPWARRHCESLSSFASVLDEGAAAGGRFTGSRWLQRACAEVKAGEAGSIPGTF